MLAVLLGLLIIGCAWRLSDFTDPEAFWSGVFVNVGTTIVLAGFIYWLERRFAVSTREAVREAATEAAVVAASEVEKRTEDLSARIESIRESVDAHRAEQAQFEDKVMSNLDESISWQSLWDAMTTTQSTGAIQMGVEVLAGTTPDAPMLEITASKAFRDEKWNVPDTLTVRLQAPPNEEGVYSVFGPEVQWVEGVPPGDAFAMLDDAMTKQGFGHLSSMLDIGAFFANLRIALSDALDGRRGLEGAWRSSAELFQVLGPDWVITDKGVEERHHGVVLPKIATPAYLEDWDWEKRFEPPRPEWADHEWWEFAVMRAFRETRRWSSRH